MTRATGSPSSSCPSRHSRPTGGCPRSVSFSSLLFVAYHSLRGAWSPDLIYADWVTRICDSVLRSPAEVAGYLAGFTLGLRFLVFGTIVCLAAGGPGERAAAVLSSPSRPSSTS